MLNYNTKPNGQCPFFSNIHFNLLTLSSAVTSYLAALNVLLGAVEAVEECVGEAESPSLNCSHPSSDTQIKNRKMDKY